jgi:hypothetical protein
MDESVEVSHDSKADTTAKVTEKETNIDCGEPLLKL